MTPIALHKADVVLDHLRAGAALHLQFTRSGPVWTMTDGRRVSNETALLVVKSASVVSDGALFENNLGQTFRWWRDRDEKEGAA